MSDMDMWEIVWKYALVCFIVFTLVALSAN